jgi:HlyD family secretion protein
MKEEKHIRIPIPDADPADFLPALQRVTDNPPSPLGRKVLWTVLALFGATLTWAMLGKLDIVAVAEGKLVPSTYVKIVQPAEQGVVKDILVNEGEEVREGQVLIRMDTALSEADGKALASDYHTKRITLRRIDAQLASQPLLRDKEDPPGIFAQAQAQYSANVQAYQTALSQERAVLDKAKNDLAAAAEVKAKLEKTLPHYREQEKAFEKLANDGFAGRLMYTDKQRERIEKEQDLKTQEYTIRSAQATIAQSERRIAQITADYRRQLEAERLDAAPQAERLRQEIVKQQHRHELLELRAPQAGLVKDLATHTPGTVAAPGTILMTLVPKDEILRAEVWVSNDDVGFVRPKQEVKIKLASFQFQKYGMIDGTIVQVSADATETPNPNTRSDALTGRDRPTGPLAFRALVDLKQQHLNADGERYSLAPGMQVISEIKLGERTVMEYLLSPVQKAWHESARER